MEFTWDRAKQQLNLRKHRLDFADAAMVFEGPTFTFVDDRFDYNEDRYVSLGLLRNMVVVIAHSEQMDIIRVISMRKATKHEERIYFEGLAD